ncbi:MAG TPA: AraC family transcriptional regulator [Bacilli bacterium]
MKYYKTIFDPSENIIMLQSKNNDGSQPHSHEFIELVYVSSGKGIHNIKGRSYLVSAGDLFIICTQDEHLLQPLSGEQAPFQWINCIFLPEFIEFDFAVFPPENKYVGTEGFEMNYMFQTMLQEFSEKNCGYLDILRGYVQIILIKLSRLLQEKATEERYSDRKMHNYLKRAVEYIHQNYQNNVSLKSLTASLSVSPSYIGKVFKEFKGMSPITYLNKYRLEQSCKLLLETSFPIHQVAEASGIKDPKFYFSLFKRTFGMTPGEFRSKYR